VTDHEWTYAGDRQTLDPKTIVAKYGCLRCGSSYEMEILRHDIGVHRDPPAWKNVGPDCDSMVVREVMGS
jgi:hypothetical protein